MEKPLYRPACKLVGEDGNAFAIIGRVRRALKDAERAGKLPAGTHEKFHQEAMAGDYDHLLQTAAAYVRESSEDVDDEQGDDQHEE